MTPFAFQKIVHNTIWVDFVSLSSFGDGSMFVFHTMDCVSVTLIQRQSEYFEFITVQTNLYDPSLKCVNYLQWNIFFLKFFIRQFHVDRIIFNLFLKKKINKNSEKNHANFIEAKLFV